MRRVITVLAAVSIATGTLVMPHPAHAADLGTVTVSYEPYPVSAYSVTPSSLSGTAGDTFTLANTLQSGNADPDYYVSVQNGTGSVTLTGTECTTANACKVLDLFNGTATGTFTVTAPGTVTVWRYYRGNVTELGTLTIGSGGASATPSDPASVYPTAYIDANGGMCTGVLQFTKYAGLNGTITLPEEPTCSRPGYQLNAWTYVRNVQRIHGADWEPFSPGVVVPIGDESFTLYAYWVPRGVEITYDANVADADPCLSGGADTMTRTSVVVVQRSGSYLQPSDGSLSASAPCTPTGMVLAGWRITSAGPTGKVYPPGTPVTDLFPDTQVGYSYLRLAAVWTVTYTLTASPTELSLSTNTVGSISVTATRNGAPAASAEVAVSATGNVTLGAGQRTSLLVTTGADGTASVPVVGGTVGTGVVTTAYGDTTATVQVTVDALQSIVITDSGRTSDNTGREGGQIRVAGRTTGFAPGSILTPWIRFPGETGFSQLTANVRVADDGTFAWGRKTGKRTAVQIRSEDGSVRSNTVVIEAR
jgi:hypothetical protein